MSDRAEVILKVSERCNLACSYCYFFERADQSFKQHPPRLLRSVARDAGKFIAQGCAELGLQGVRIDLHGGEPLLIGKDAFSDICEILTDALSPGVEFELTVQTNATLIDDDWINIFARYQVKVGVSLDGAQALNDRFRVDRSGNSSYLATVAGINLLQAAARVGRISKIGLLAVINPSVPASDTYRHFVDVVGIRRMDFLLPNATHDEAIPFEQPEIGCFLCDLFDAWIDKEDYKTVRVRLLDSVVALLLGERSRLFGIGEEDGYSSELVTIASDGALSPDDTLRGCGAAVMFTGMNVYNATLKQFLRSEHISHLERQRLAIPPACRECCWYRCCGSGFMVHRYSQLSAFNNPSVHCVALKMLFAHVSKFLVSAGLTVEELAHNLGI